MANVCDYVKWRGDLELKNDEFNEIDGLILSRLSYFPFEQLAEENEEITIEEFAKRFEQADQTTLRILWEDDKYLIPLLGKSARFGKMLVTNMVNKFNKEEERQFFAVTVVMPDNTIFVTFRGTDDTLVGWKEDFNMSFSELVPAQTDAANYLNNIAYKYKNNIRVGGHSKGGNLAVYAAAFCDTEIQDRIINVYNNDGPGFCDKIINSKQYQNIIKKVHTYIPQSSIIGRLLNHQEEITILKSTQTGIMQHDLYTWQVLGGEFVKDELTNSSEFIDKTITNWLKEVSPEQRGEFFDTLFDILNTTEAKTLSELSKNKLETAKRLLESYKHIDDESKELLSKTLSVLFQSARRSIIIKKKEK